MVDTLTRTLVHEPPACRGCGDGLLLAPVTGRERRQVVDLPPVAPVVIEHQLVERECACCGTRTKADAPAGVDTPVQYGPGVEARVLSLYGGQFLAKDRAADAMRELYGVAVSPGTVVAMLARAAARLAEQFLPQVRDLLAAAPVLGVDETGLRVAKNRDARPSGLPVACSPWMDHRPWASLRASHPVHGVHTRRMPEAGTGFEH
ncbi:IS66 family transposase zinc-finger binding domain-containing protein [Frankia sp. Cr1]|uniref:IS66 family transposase zinc-finger binding domain-containing protein n=1 Tax=Frankia sp. Cr1 TaxID=3073931 RepID=UPI002AD3096F|nr:transposase [Frankia sp. Cr1]